MACQPLAVLAGLLCLLFPGREFAHAQIHQANNHQFEHLTTEHGLSHNFVMYIMQDRKGYLWFGTGNGLDKYDGYGFTNYRFDPYDSTTVPKNQVFMMWEDSLGKMWVGTSEGTSIFDPDTEKFTRLEKSVSNPYAFKYAQSINQDGAGNMWVGGSFEGDLRQVDSKTGKFSATNYARMLFAGTGTDGESSINLHVGYKDRKGVFWIGSPYGLHRLNLTPAGPGKPDEVSFTHYRHDPANPNSISHNTVTGILEDHNGILWIMTQAGILNAFDRKTGKFTHYNPNPDQPLDIYGLLISGLAEDLEGNLWIGSFNGLYKLDKERKAFTSFFHDPTDPGSISSNAIVSLLVDKAGILWVATMAGVDKLDPNKKPFRLYSNNASNPNSLSHNSIAALYEDQQGILWVGTTGGGLNELNKLTGDFRHYRHNPKDRNSLRSDVVSAILEDRKGNLWVGNGDVLSRYNRKTKRFTHYPLTHTFLSNPAASPIFTIYEDRQGNIWLGTNNGIIHFSPETGKTINYPYDPNNPRGISDYWALSILEDRYGNLWIGHGSQALDRFDPKTGKYTHYAYHNKEAGSISSNTVPCIYEDSSGELWFGTGEGGLCRFDHASETFTCFTEKQGLRGNTVFSILEDDAGNLWLGTNDGISSFSPDSEIFTNYDVGDGLQGKLYTAVFVEAAACKGKDGTLYFGGNRGFNAFDPAAIRANPYVPPVVITQFRLFDQPLPGKSESEEIVLDHHQNFFSFEFAALNYTSTAKNQYAYQLEGVDKEWVQAGTRRSASYTDIGPGKYIFKVKGSNNDGVWNEKGALLSIIINPPWWRTWWAYGCYGLLFLGCFAVVDRVQRNRLIQQEREKTRERELEQAYEIEKAYHELQLTQTQLVQKEKAELENELQLERLKKEQELAAYQSRMVELEMQALRAQMNPHFIFNCLNSINRFILKNESEAASDYLTKFSKLIRLILQNSQYTSVSLDKELEALRLYIEMEVLRFDNQFTYEILLDPYMEVEELELPPLVIQPYVENAIWHGLMHKSDKGHLLIELRVEQQLLFCQITDNGIGRQRAAMLKSKSASKNKSLGMQITSHRLELINSLNEKETTVEVIDLVDPEGEACGTKVLLKIPL
ncbi:signal transduction histidine kinase [Flammeovirgaceae bacterium 311]|nr:signal transduction histidine kinase [Flammeovirgaceae bacterium 311]